MATQQLMSQLAVMNAFPLATHAADAMYMANFTRAQVAQAAANASTTAAPPMHFYVGTVFLAVSLFLPLLF